MSLAEFIAENTETIDAVITAAIPNRVEAYGIDDEDREDWVMNDSGLYSMAVDAGVEEI